MVGTQLLGEERTEVACMYAFVAKEDKAMPTSVVHDGEGRTEAAAMMCATVGQRGAPPRGDPGPDWLGPRGGEVLSSSFYFYYIYIYF